MSRPKERVREKMQVEDLQQKINYSEDDVGYPIQDD